MSEEAEYCPFLNSTDSRCSEKFNLDHMSHAFSHCFDKYGKCPVYAQRLAEGQIQLHSQPDLVVFADADSTRQALDSTMRRVHVRTHLRAELVQITVARVTLEATSASAH